MPDLSMCADATCPSRARCYRHADSGTDTSQQRRWADFGRQGAPSCWAFCPQGLRKEWRDDRTPENR